MFLLNIKDYCNYKSISEQGLYKQFRKGTNNKYMIKNKNYVIVDEEFEEMINKKTDEYKTTIKNLEKENKELKEKEFRVKNNLTISEDNNKRYLLEIEKLKIELKEPKNKGFFQKVFNLKRV